MQPQKPKNLFRKIETWQIPVFIKEKNSIIMIDAVDKKLTNQEIIKKYGVD